MLYIWCTKPTDSTVYRSIGQVIKANAWLEHRVIKVENGVLPSTKKGDVVLACGTKALNVLQKYELVKKNRTVTSLRGIPIETEQATYLVTFDPRIITREYGRSIDIRLDTNLAIRLVKTGTVEPKLGHYRWVDDFSDVVDWVKAKHQKTGKKVPLSLDLETVGFDEISSETHIVSIFFTYKPGQADGVHFTGQDDPLYPINNTDQAKKLYEQLQFLCTSPSILMRGANLKFDCRWLARKFGIDITNFKFDTTLVGSLLDENRSNSLNIHAKLFTSIGGYDDSFNRSFDKSRMDLIPKEDLLPYAGGDTDSCYQVAEVLRGELLKNGRLANFYVKLLHPASVAFGYMEQEGVLLDQEFYFHPVAEYKTSVDDDGNEVKVLVRGLKAALEDHIKKVESEGLSYIPRLIKNKYVDNLSINRAALIKEYMFTSPRGLKLTPKMRTAKTGEPSTALDHLKQFADNPKAADFIRCLQDVGTTKKTLSTYVEGFSKHLREDGRFHPTYLLFKGEYRGAEDSGTNSGRTSAKDPAVQTIPKHSKWAKYLRRGYIAPKGYKMVNIDYSQGELRVAACIANEETMIAAYRDGADLHLVTGATVNGYSQEEIIELKKLAETDDNIKKKLKAIRQGGKSGNFGLLYGMGAKGFMEYARNSYGVVMTLGEAMAARDGFFSLYPNLVRWHEKSKAFAKKHEYISSPLGRVRHLPLINSPDGDVRSKAERQAVNSQVQSTLSDLGQLSLVMFHQQYGRPEDCRPCMFCHDAIVFYIKEDKLDTWIPRCVHIMENLPLKNLFGWDPQIPFIVDVEIGDNMATMA